MQKALWILTAIGCVVAAGVLTLGLKTANSAPQEAAAAGMAVAFAVIPYCLARAVDQILKIK